MYTARHPLPDLNMTGREKAEGAKWTTHMREQLGQGKAATSQRPAREQAERAIDKFLTAELGECPAFSMCEDGGEDSGDKCGWAFWILPDDTTSYVFRDLRVQWLGTEWTKEAEGGAAQPVLPPSPGRP